MEVGWFTELTVYAGCGQRGEIAAEFQKRQNKRPPVVTGFIQRKDVHLKDLIRIIH